MTTLPYLTGLIGIIILLALMLLRMPVAFAFGLVGFVGFAYKVKFAAALQVLSLDFFGIFSSYHMTVIPLFILMGQLAFQTGISRKLFTTAHTVFGRTRGGLAMSAIAACAGFAAICGSSPASAATMGSVALPEMRRRAYDDRLATGCIAAGGTLGILIPPSVILIIYGIMTEQSISKLFVAGILPGITLSLLFILAIYIATTINPALGPGGERTTLRQKASAIINGGGETLLIFVLLMGGLFVGIFTPSEGGAIGVVCVLFIGVARRQIAWKGLGTALADTIKLSSMILLIIAGATVFGHFLAATRLPMVVASAVSELPLPRIYIMVLILVLYIVGGCVMDAMALLLLTLPIFFPVVEALGYDPIWFGIMATVMMETAGITPPVGLNVYVIKGIAKDVPLEKIFKGIFPFFLADLTLVIILLAFPQVALVLTTFMR